MSPKNKGGRPSIDNPRSQRAEIRLSHKEVEMIDFCCKHTGMTRSDIIREGINEVYNRLKNKK